MSGYLEDRLNDAGARTVCEGCKGRTIPFAKAMARDLEDGGQPEEAEAYRRLARTIFRETGRDRSGD